MELSENHDWRMANLGVAAYIAVCGLCYAIQQRDTYFGLIDGDIIRGLLSGASGIIISRLGERYLRAIRQYEPPGPIEAKRANEQIKYTANFANTVAGAWVSIVVISEIVRAESLGKITIFMSIGIALLIHHTGRNMVGLLKDEAITSKFQA